MSDINIRPQAAARPLYELNSNNLVGLEQTVRNNQPLMALQYAANLIKELMADVIRLETEISTLKQAPVAVSHSDMEVTGKRTNPRKTPVAVDAEEIAEI